MEFWKQFSLLIFIQVLYTHGQKIPFDEHFYGSRGSPGQTQGQGSGGGENRPGLSDRDRGYDPRNQNQNPTGGNELSFRNAYFSNGTHTLYRNETGSGSLNPNPYGGTNQYGGSNPNPYAPSGQFPSSDPNYRPGNFENPSSRSIDQGRELGGTGNLNTRNSIDPNYGRNPSRNQNTNFVNTNQETDLRRESSGSYRNANSNTPSPNANFPGAPNYSPGSSNPYFDPNRQNPNYGTGTGTNYSGIRNTYGTNPNPYQPNSNPYQDSARNPGTRYQDANVNRNYQETRANYQAGQGAYPDRSNYQNPPGSDYPSNYPGVNYGQPSRTYPQYPGRAGFDPGYPNRNIWNEQWSTTTLRPIAPGVLGMWRPDLQGRQRPEDIHQPPQSVFVTTSYGRVQGFRVKLYDGPDVPLPSRPGITSVDRVQNTVLSFVGIPYAKPPTQDARFKPPRPHQGWQVHQAVEFGPACPQPARFFGYTAGIVQVDEDCLYLNVYSPDLGSGAEGSPFPVIFYIHDGDFMHGGSQTFPPHQLVAWYRVVVVTVNFRLGALGFLSTADEFSPGNYGMLDLSLALKWVHDNIRSFNGDPNRITLLGLGSGGAAAGLLMLSPRTRGFVKNVIALEGAATADWAAINDRYRLQNTTQLYSLKLGCWNEWDTTSWSMVQCLRTRSWQELANLELDPDVGTFPWSPAVDKTFKVPLDDYQHEWKEEDWRFLPDSPEDILRAGDYPYVKYMTGYSRQAAADLLYENKTLAPNFVVTREWFDQQIHLWVKKYNYTLNPEGVFSAIRYAYTYWPDPTNTTHLREEYIQFLSDALYRAPIDQTVKLLLARGIQVHSYLLNYTLEGLRLPEWREVPRGLEYYLLSGAPFMDPEFLPERLRVDRSTWTEGDRNMSHFLMEAVANMAYTGNPTPREILGVYWERATPADLKYLALNGTNNSTMQRNYRQRELTFWTEYMPFVVGRLVPTYAPTTEYWWEPNEPLQIAFWSVSGICLILIVGLVACCLLWRTAKKQRDRVYADYGPGNRPLGVGPMIVGDEMMSEYAASVKTADSLDSGVKLSHNPNAPLELSLYQPQIHSNPGAVSQMTLASRDRYPTPRRFARSQGALETPQTQV